MVVYAATVLYQITILFQECCMLCNRGDKECESVRFKNCFTYCIISSYYVCRNLPLSLLIGIPIVTLCYLLVNIAFFAVLDYHQILSSETVALV